MPDSLTPATPAPCRTRRELTTANTIARRFTEAVCAERRTEVDALLDQGVRFLQAAKDAGMPADFIDETARGFLDQLSNLMADINRDLDGADKAPAEPLCLVELEALFPKGNDR